MTYNVVLMKLLEMNTPLSEMKAISIRSCAVEKSQNSLKGTDSFEVVFIISDTEKYFLCSLKKLGLLNASFESYFPIFFPQISITIVRFSLRKSYICPYGYYVKCVNKKKKIVFKLKFIGLR